MKKIVYLCVLTSLMISCKDKTSETKVDTEPSTEKVIDVTTSAYPENITKVFAAHGGLDAWNEMATLEFSVEKPGGYEITTTDLKDRYALIEMPKHTIGFDGEVLWMKNRDKSNYDGNPKFYYNLMFYFYAMPFVLADDGIMYAEAEPLVFEGKTYPGIQISYKNGVGASSDDEYVLYYDADSYKMAWLAYTVTFGNEKSTKFSYINYNNWQEVEGITLPETMVWYNVENNQPTTVKSEIKFVSPMMTTVKMDSRVYGRPEGGEIIQ
ncbi:DUF6503 family protein [Gelidibacter mesophilus]|uniref:DUF6503 family protein n=1 Tax=Gelidibacter mesophilus TaxID=169050 RepID=UPI000486A5FD|nr:DUF6503 family protein [Gelidibacter mesophilus]